MDAKTLGQLHAARTAEKEQALYYRRLAAAAEDAGDAALAERMNGLHADEQHHLSRLTARLLELGERPEPLRDVRAPEADLDAWEGPARERERAEIARYDGLLDAGLDDDTRTLIEEILEAERRHEERLGGKWMRA